MPFSTLIDAAQLDDILKLKNTAVIDTRFWLADPDGGWNDYRRAHIPGAHYAHLDRDLSSPLVAGVTGRHPLPEIGQFERRCRSWGISEGTQVVVYDQGPGGIGARLWWMLRWLGHEAVALLDGGWTSWMQSGLPVSTETPPPGSGDFTARPDDRMTVSAAQVSAMRKRAEVALVDSRAAERYRGENEPIDPIAGHIPTAVSAPYLDTTSGDGLSLSKAELCAHFERVLAGRQPEESVFYCGSGVTACRNLLAMEHAGLHGARLYPGSWSEWIALGGDVETGDPS